MWAAANSCGSQGYTGERDSSDFRGFVHPLSGKRRPEGKPEGILEMCVISALHLGRWNCFDLICFSACSIWFTSCQSRVISRALETQTFFFTFGFKIIHSAAGIQLASGNDGVEFHHQKTVKTVLWSLNRIFEMSKELLWGSTGRIRDPLRARFKYFIIRTIILCKDDVLRNYTNVVLMAS